jgi:hypothetical protein
MLTKMSTDPHSDDFINPLPLCMPIFLDQAVRSLLLKQMPIWMRLTLLCGRLEIGPVESRFLGQTLPVPGGVWTPPRAPTRGKGR